MLHFVSSFAKFDDTQFNFGFKILTEQNRQSEFVCLTLLLVGIKIPFGSYPFMFALVMKNRLVLEILFLCLRDSC